LALAGQPRSNSEAGKPNPVGVADQHIFRLDVLMYDSVPMDLGEGRRQADGDAQGAGQIERLPLASLKNQIQRLTARVFEYEGCSPFVTTEGQRRGSPCGGPFGGERVFVLKPLDTLRRWLFCGECDRQDWRGVAMLSAAVKREVRTFPEGYKLVPRRPREGGHSRRHAYKTPGTHSDERAGRRQRQ